MEEKKEKREKQEEKIGQALLKVALGYQLAEVTEEYAEVNGELKLTKRKKTKKDVPPDLKAVQLLLSSDGADYAQWSDEELEAEKRRLLAILQEENLVKTEKNVESKGMESKAGTGRKPRAKPRKRVVRKVKTEN